MFNISIPIRLSLWILVVNFDVFCLLSNVKYVSLVKRGRRKHDNFNIRKSTILGVTFSSHLNHYKLPLLKAKQCCYVWKT